MVSRLGVAPFVATLGTLTAGSGIAYVIGGGAPINGLPEEWGKIANTALFGVQVPVLIMIAGFIISLSGAAQDLLRAAGLRGRRQPHRRRRRRGQIGPDPHQRLRAQRRARRPVRSHPVLPGHLRTPQPRSGYELAAIAAVVIGGASLLGGRGSVWGTLLGLLLIQTLNNGLDLLIVPAYWQKVISGVLIVDRRRRRRLGDRRRRNGPT